MAARFIFDWKTSKIERNYQENMTKQEYHGGPSRKVVDIFSDELRAAGVLGTESLHCTFIGGVWDRLDFTPDSRTRNISRARVKTPFEEEAGAQLLRELEQAARQE